MICRFICINLYYQLVTPFVLSGTVMLNTGFGKDLTNNNFRHIFYVAVQGKILPSFSFVGIASLFCDEKTLRF